MLNRKKIFAALIVFVALCNFSFSQGPIRDAIGVTRIQYLNIKDKTVLEYLQKYIDEKTDSSNRFVGYIVVNFDSKPSEVKETLRHFSIRHSVSSFDDIENDAQFPPYYTMLNNKIILFKFSNLNDLFILRYTNKSKRKFLRVIEPFLFPKSTLLFPSDKGKFVKDKKFRKGEQLLLNNGWDVNILLDGSVIVNKLTHY